MTPNGTKPGDRTRQSTPSTRESTLPAANEDLLRKLEAEVQARRVAVAEAERHRRFAEALERVATAEDASDGVDEFLRKLLEIFVEVSGVDVAVVRLREGDRLRSRAAVGLEDEVAAGFSLLITEGFAGRVAAERKPVFFPSASSDPGCMSPFIREKGVQS